MYIKIKELEDLSRKVILKYGYTQKEAQIIIDILMYAQLRGNNQGIVKLTGMGIPKDPKAGKIKYIKRTKLSALLDGNKNFGMIVMYKAMEIAIEKAKKYGFGIVGTSNTYSSTGAIGYYVRKIAENNLIGFAYSGSPATVPPYGSYEAKFGTNPQAVGIPTSKDPMVFDMATSAMAWFGLVQANIAGKKIPDDVAYDAKGKATTDPEKAMEGAVRTFDRSYKGYGLSMLFEILSGPLVGASFAGIRKKQDWGNLIFIINPKLLVDVKKLKRDISKMIKTVKASKKLKGVKEIFVPGEKGDNLTKACLRSGKIEIERNLYNELKKVVGN